MNLEEAMAELDRPRLTPGALIPVQPINPWNAPRKALMADIEDAMSNYRGILDGSSDDTTRYYFIGLLRIINRKLQSWESIK